ncbi:MAG: SAM-dependent methyltransferase [Chloroflexi bacterium]|nr:SAM-dependent methyltransferase [Chloroflexota bacterium]
MSESALLIAEAVDDYLAPISRSHLLKRLSACDAVDQANTLLYALTGVRSYFPNQESLREFRRVLSLPPAPEERSPNRQWGDFQTPLDLASRVCRTLADDGVSPRVIVEPTYGAGNFILAALKSFTSIKRVYAVEIQDKYQWHLKAALLTQALHGHRPAADIELHKDDIFTHRFPKDLLGAHDLLVLGNPPWVTNAELGSLQADNLPTKRNIKALNGLSAITGKSNFDIGEYILLRLLELFSTQPGTLAMLCKNSVIRNVVESLPRQRFTVADVRAHSIDAKREFGASVDASLLVMRMGASSRVFHCQLASLDNTREVNRAFGWVGEKFVSDVRAYEALSDLDGESPIIWRQGLKHDCVGVMELDYLDGLLINSQGETVDVEEQWVHWLLKSSDLRKFEVTRARKKVILPQNHIRDDTSMLREEAPRLWSYLVKNAEHLDKRKSGIYQGRPRFSIFGVGHYSFKPYKVAISGLYKQPVFSMVMPIDQRPVLLDDTCYFLGFDTYLECLFTATILNSRPVQDFLQSVVFTDAKRPYTKELLMRIDLGRAANKLSFDQLREEWDKVACSPGPHPVERDFEEYKERLFANSRAKENLQYSLGI